MNQIVKEFKVGGKSFGTMADAEAHARYLHELERVAPFLETYKKGRARSMAENVMEAYFKWLATDVARLLRKDLDRSTPPADTKSGNKVEEPAAKETSV